MFERRSLTSRTATILVSLENNKNVTSRDKEQRTDEQVTGLYDKSEPGYGGSSSLSEFMTGLQMEERYYFLIYSINN